jgi:membrane protein
MSMPSWIPEPLSRILSVPVGAVQDFIQEDGPARAASLSFFALLSLAPMLLVVTELAGWWLGTEAAAAQLRQWAGQYLQGDAAAAVYELLDQLADMRLLRTWGVWAWIGAGSTLFIATTLVVQIQDGLNRIWHVRPDPERRDIVVFLVKRGVSMAVVLAAVVAVIASAVLNVATEALLSWTAGVVPEGSQGVLWAAGSTLASWLVMMVLVTVAFRVLPDVKIRWRDALVGGAFTALLIEVGTALIGWYLGVAAVGSAWGASGAVAVFLFWVYYTSNILLLGAALTRRYTLTFGGGMKPGKLAVSVRYEIVDEQGDAVQALDEVGTLASMLGVEVEAPGDRGGGR